MSAAEVFDRGDRRRFRHPWRIHLVVAGLLLAVLYGSILLDASHPWPPTGPRCTFEQESGGPLTGSEEHSGGLLPKRACVVTFHRPGTTVTGEVRHSRGNRIALWVGTALFFQVTGLLVWAVITSVKGAATQVQRAMAQAAEPPLEP